MNKEEKAELEAVTRFIAIRRATQKKYLSTEKGRKTHYEGNERYRTSEKGKAAQARYLQSEKGKEASKRAHDKYVTKMQKLQKKYAKELSK